MGSQRGAVGTVRTCEGPRGPCAGDNEREVQRPNGVSPTFGHRDQKWAHGDLVRATLSDAHRNPM